MTSAPKVAVVGALTLLAVLAAVALGVGTSRDPAPSNKTPALSISAGAIYSASFPDMSGQQQSLGQWQHHLLVINFWAPWCAPCREEMPIFEKIHRENAGKKLQIIGIAADSRLNVANFNQAGFFHYMLLPDELGAIEFSKRLGNAPGLLPHTVVLAPGGNAVFAKLGGVSAAELEAVIREHLPK